MRVLVARGDYHGFTRGERVTDKAKIEEILAGEHAHHFLKTDFPDVTDAVGPHKPADTDEE